MGLHTAITGRPVQGARQTMEMAQLPAPVKGMDGRVAVSQTDPLICLTAQNIIPSNYGMRVRNGYREWQVGVGSEVRTVVPYNGAAQDQSADRMFAVSEDGIYDVSIQGATPILKFAFSVQSAESGYGVYTHFTDGAGISYLLYADSENGLFVYYQETDEWIVAPELDPAPGAPPFDVANVNFVVSHKQRLWLVQKNTTTGWYLPVASTKGDVTPFYFGSKFKHGGELIGLYNWSVDGGGGIDDHLVAISRAGDVLPYRGEDPSAALTWSNIGTYFIGNIPKGNRISSEYGGDLFMLSSLGITSMTDLLSGSDVADPYRSAVGFKIATQLRNDLSVYENDPGWNIKFISSQGLLMISMPFQSNTGLYKQYVYNLATTGWGLWFDVPLLTSDPWEGKLMIGTADGRILRMDVHADDVDVNGEGGRKINWYLLSSYSDMGSPAKHKRVKYIRPNFVSTVGPSYSAWALYDFDISRNLGNLSTTPNQISLWNTAAWNEDVWEAGGLQPFFRVMGTWGMGRTIAIAMQGASSNETIFGSWDVGWDVGGFM
jgi:hypothetical protein